ncbi:STAS domain-containing protein [Actinoplanes sp. LDG1-06]|uniref:STAS domain-containing protein n=1 Tax=Paractinoplanes ovalisporus TaxID=2810368 RepID=A0ABS2A822_9ACTN|nr:STAS domain-containing protein [Actinoplanes ovalisporus]MBM2615993.1 STAS domain-containing protein [Actinoplanes ovalisporus]
MTVDNTPSLLHVRTTSSGAAFVSISITGELDVGNSAWLRGWIVDIVDRYRPAVLSLDLSALRFIDVAGVRALYELHSAADARGCTLTVGEIHYAVRLTLDRLGLSPSFLAAPAPLEPWRCA